MSNTRKKLNVALPGRAYWRAAFLAVLLAVLYLSLMPSLPVVLKHQLPHWMGRWSGLYDFSANVLAFGALAFSALMGFVAGTRPAHSTNRAAALPVAGIVAYAGALELVQYRFLPTRSCHWRDVVAAGIGAGLALVVSIRVRSGSRR